MFRSKKDVDRHVRDIFVKLKNSEEKHLRCYNIAKLYYQVGDYESAKKYVSNYLEIREKSAGAHKLLGQALEALGQKEAAFIQYKTSLEIEAKQDDLVLKVCELLTDVDVNLDVNRIRYWVDRADKKFPHHPIVFQLKEKMLTQEKPSGNNDDLEKLITSELLVRQMDVHLQVKLLRHYIGNHRLEEAYNHAAGIEAMHSHRNSVVWYQSLSELLVKYKESKQSDWTFWIFYISVLERYAALCLKEQGSIMKKNILDATQAVFNFDQSLTEFKSKNFSNHPTFIENMLLHMWGQLHFHLACLFLRKTKGGEDSWTEAGRLCAPLLLTALHVTPIDPTGVWTMHLKDRLTKQVRVWYREGSYRCSQAGHVIQDYARDNTKKLLDKIDKFCTNSWRERVYQRIFVGRLYQDGKATSYFSNTSVSNPPLRLCSYTELKRFDEISEEVWPDSLHHQIWLGLRTRPQSSQSKDNVLQPNQTSRVFCELQFSVFNISQASPDSLSRLDIDAFLNAAIFCASAVIEEQQLSGFLNPERLPTLPADLTNTLCTCAQEKWWSSAYKVYSMDKQKPLDDDLGEIRTELQRGLEVVRCIGNHGLHPVLLVHLARIFHYRAEALKETNPESSEIGDLETRSEMYWSNAVPLLERLLNNQVLRVTNSKFFNYQGKEMNNAELIKAVEEGKLLLAQRLVREKQYEKAIDVLHALKCPEASFQQAQMYEMLADDIVSSIPKDSLTSEMRSQHIIMLSKARECFYLTLDRLRSPGMNPKHPLNSELSTHIADIENKLKRIDPDWSRGNLSRNECDGLSEESYSSAHSGVDQTVGNPLPTFTGTSASINIASTPQKNNYRTPKQSSTPYRPQHHDLLDLSRTRSEARPSPERLDAQIRAINQMIHAKDSMIQSITEQNKAILDLNKTVVEKVEELSKEVAELRKEIQRQRSQAINVNPNLEEDLCVLNEEELSDLNYTMSQSGPASSISGNMFPSSHRHPYSQLVYPSATAFQGYYPGGMSFSDPSAQAIPSLYPPNVYQLPVLYPNTRSKLPETILQQGLFPTRLPDLMPPTNQPLQIPLQKVETLKPETTIKDAPVNKVPPVNVVITASDTLPTTVPVTQPMLSVTIPPHFRQGTTTTAHIEQAVPHSYQISMPSQATIPTTVNLPPLAATLTTTPANISMPEAQGTDNTNLGLTISTNNSDHEHDPIPNFVPVIPLPAEVKVTTGEEGEETLFCARAKLFRFVDNEWKERGIGNVKLLRNGEGKVRLLMRREQVFKVCANHYLSPDMELAAKSNNEKAWVWVAHDFADGELKVEKFCIRFKTVEEGISFKEHFEKAIASLSQLSERVDKPSVEGNSVSTAVEGAEKAKPEITPVEQSNQKQPMQMAATAGEALSEKSKAATVVGGFSFTSTPIIKQVAATEPSKASSKPENRPFAGFTFSKTASTAESTATAAQKSSAAGAASATSQASSFSFAKAAVPSPAEAATAPAVATSDSAAANIPQPSLRRPHAPPPSAATSTSAAVGVQSTDTKIDQETVLFEDRTTLQYYNSDTKQWETRGAGQMKVLWSKKTGRVRLLMIEESGGKVCYNYNVLAKMQFTLRSNSNTIVNWCIQHGPDKKTGMFVATFKLPAQATKFHNTITKNQQKMVKNCVPAEKMKKRETTSKPQASLAEMFKPATGSWECNACYTRNAASDEKCIACQMLRPSAPNTVSAVSTSAPTSSNQVPLSQMFKPPAGSWKCNTCYIVNTAGNSYCVACDTPKDPSMPPKPKTDGFQIGTSTSGATPTYTFGIPQDTTKKNASGFTFKLPASNDTFTDPKSTSSSAPESNAKADSTKFVFGMPQPRPSTPPSKESPFTFGSPGKSFGFNFVPKSPVKSAGGGDNSEDEIVENDDIHFLPIIPLPDKVDVKTGEEDEEILYSHRAKLFRYDKSTNEWKERGLGDIKLLRHKETGKLRLIMRREQILKVCLNHFLPPSLELKPKDDKTWFWNAADYSEGEVEPTLFACRFKTPDIAKDFKSLIDDALAGKELPAIEINTEASTDAPAKVSLTQDIEILYEAKVTAAEKEAALKLLLPENFYAYKQKPDCPGCRGCKEPSMPLFQDGNSEKVASKQETTTTTSTIQFSSKYTDANAATNDVAVSDQAPVSYSNTQNAASTAFKPGLYETSTTQSTTSFLSVMAPTTISFGNSDLNDKKTGFSFAMPPSQYAASEPQQFATNMQSALEAENLKICSPATCQAQTTSTASSPFMTPALTSSTSIFGASATDTLFNLNSGKNMFGGGTKKDAPGLIKPSSFNVNTGTTEPVFSTNFGTQTKTTTPATTVTTYAFGTNTPIFGSSTTKVNSETTANSVFDNTSKPFLFTTNYGVCTNESPFAISNTATTNIFDTKAVTPSENESQEFLSSAEVSFSDLAAKAPQQAFKIDPNFSFAGAGAAVFGGKSTMPANKLSKDAPKEKKDENDEGECDENDQEQHDPHFEPIVPLPDVIEVRTGEEDEERVFCERAKLYRYDNTTREWKERGVGDMKILHHAEHETYRLLLRRDQVHKVVCNLLLTLDVNFSRLSTSDRAWVWAGMNYAEEQPCLEKLAVKFKNPELATKFKDTVDKIQRTLSEIREKVTEAAPVIEEPEDEDENEEGDEIDDEDEEGEEDDEDDGGEEEEDEDDDDEDQKSIIFKKRATVLAKTSKETKWKSVGLGNLFIYYDYNICGERIVLKADQTNEVMSNTIISMNTYMQVDGKECVWTAIDYALKPVARRTLKAMFSSVQAAEQMYNNFQDGVGFAKEADIDEPYYEE